MAGHGGVEGREEMGAIDGLWLAWACIIHSAAVDESPVRGEDEEVRSAYGTECAGHGLAAVDEVGERPAGALDLIAQTSNTILLVRRHIIAADRDPGDIVAMSGDIT